ncbi:MFS general substrate transporter [Mycena chlorophos]|uniref:MFS general substrate transporter n=1 Tax=Mycena chlorophos TaxID=658473 RepID=A0A8H6SDI1_MYCCL|nr:MFS general substrate transporter [Mycena chlorophos]
MPAFALAPRNSNSNPSSSPSVDIGLVVGLSIGAVVLLVVLAALLLPSWKARRGRASKRPMPTTLQEFMSKAGPYAGYQQQHRREDSFVENMPLVAPQPFRPPPAPQPEPYNPPRQPPGLGLHVVIPEAHAPTAPLRYARRPPSPELESPDSSASSESEYSQRSASTRRAKTLDFVSPPPPVPPLPANLQQPEHMQKRRKSSRRDKAKATQAKPEPEPLPQVNEDEAIALTADTPMLNSSLHLGLQSELSPEASPLSRGDTVVVAGLLKSRARRLENSHIERSMTRTSVIERAGSIREGQSPEDVPEHRASAYWRPRLPPTKVLSVESEDSLDFYETTPVEERDGRRMD